MNVKKKKVKKNSFARVRSFQHIAASSVAKDDVVGEKSRNNSNGSANDTDEKVNDKATSILSKSHGARSFKKPCSTSSQRKSTVIQDCNDNDSAYTGKSFYDCPNQQEETKKQINNGNGLRAPGGANTPIKPVKARNAKITARFGVPHARVYLERNEEQKMKASVAEKSADGAMVNRRFDASPDQNASVVSRYPPYDGDPQQTTPGESHSLYSKMMVDS